MKIERCFIDKDHPLILREKNTSDQALIICRICTRIVSEASFYACDQCGYYLHSLCTDLPHQIILSFHFNDDHPLTLLNKEKNYYCHNCEKVFESVPVYKCTAENHFYLHVECALMPVKSSPCRGEGEARWIHHISHPHSLFLIRKDGATCKACGLTCSDGLAYACTELHCGDFFMHQSCAEFPREIQHPHGDSRQGYMSLRFRGISFTCSMCCRSNGFPSNYFFGCNFRDCMSKLCWSCVRRRLIVYEGECDNFGDYHKMQFVEKMDTELAECDDFEGYCMQPHTASSNEISHNKSSILKCADCKFKLHVLCGPLPSTVKHECHIHSLTLVDSLVEDDYDDFYCDVCEEKRDPRIRFYYCKACKYFAHVDCSFIEIAKVLSTEEDQLNNVELKIVGQDLWNLPNLEVKDNEKKLHMTLWEVIYSLVGHEEYYRLKRFYSWPWNINDTDANLNYPTPQSGLIMSTEDIDESLKLIRFTYSDFETFLDHLLEKFVPNNAFLIKPRYLNLEVVNVEGYMVPHTVRRVLRAVLHRYGDISTDSENYSRAWKSFTYFVVCEVLRNMSTKLVIDITKDDLREWCHHLKFAKNEAGFKVDFACSLLEKQVRAFLALQADKLNDKVPETLSRSMAILADKMAKLQNEIDEVKSKLEICNEYSGPALKSQFMRDCLKEAFDTKLKRACCARDLSSDLQRSPNCSNAWKKE